MRSPLLAARWWWEADLGADLSGVFSPSAEGFNDGFAASAPGAGSPATSRRRYARWECVRGRTQRNFNLDPTGTGLLPASQDPNNVVRFRVDQDAGGRTHLSQVQTPPPVCVVFRLT